MRQDDVLRADVGPHKMATASASIGPDASSRGHPAQVMG